MVKHGVVRLVDVAEQAGVTVSTASRALSRPEMVRPETRERVEAAARALGYVPNLAARSLITGRSGVVSVIIPDLSNEYYASIAQAAQVTAREHGYEVFIADSGFDPDRESALVDVASRGADGVIVCTAQRRHTVARDGVPLVYVNKMVRGHHAVVVDPHSVLEAQVDHLLALGHERILIATGPDIFWVSEVRSLHAARLAKRLPSITIDEYRGPSYGGGRRLVDHLDPSVTAVAALNDRQAIGILQRAAEVGIRIPDDLSVVGCDDLSTAAFVSPALTTVRVPTEALGRAAVSLLIDHVTDDGPVIAEQMVGELVVRDSTAPPRTAA